MAQRLVAACLGALLSGAHSAWVNGQEEVDEAALRAAKQQQLKVMKDHEKAADQNHSCFKESSGYVPLDMKGSKFTFSENAAMCQARCAQTEGCDKWTYYEPLGHCHVTDKDAMLGVGVVGFTSGPKVCRMENCTTEMSSYWPWLDPQAFYRNFSRTEALQKCQDLCLFVAACAHFVLKIPSQDCHLAGRGALKYRMYSSVTGPPTCEGRKIVVLKLDEEPLASEEGLQTALRPGSRLGRAFALAGALVGAAALAVVGLAATRGRRRGGRAPSFDRAPQQSLDEKLSGDRPEEGDACLPAA